MIEKLNYYILTSYRRKMLDKALNQNIQFFKGKVLDVGGGKKDGIFRNPQKDNWIVVDISKRGNPDVVANVEKLPFKKGSFDVVKATELFEHVDDLEKGFSECVRVLKKGGILIISSPFMYPVHSDPFDFQRISKDKWFGLAQTYKAKIIKLEEQGYFFTLFAQMVRTLIINVKISIIRYLLYLFLPVLDSIHFIDRLPIVKKSSILNKYVCGYFLIVEKVTSS